MPSWGAVTGVPRGIHTRIRPPAVRTRSTLLLLQPLMMCDVRAVAADDRRRSGRRESSEGWRWEDGVVPFETTTVSSPLLYERTMEESEH